MGHTLFFSHRANLFLLYIEKAGFIALFTQEINLHPKEQEHLIIDGF